MQTMDPGILCFQHASDEPKTYCMTFPENCKYCNADLSNCELHIPLFTLPYPFKKASEEKASIVLKPSSGDFLNHYNNFSDLHIGVTDYSGVVFEFDRNGFQRGRYEGWDQCIAFKIFDNIDEPLQLFWDNMLYVHALKGVWNKEKYNPVDYNCYTFVLTYLQSLRQKEINCYVYDKVLFCKRYVCPQTRIAAKYISIYRFIKMSELM